MDAACIGIFSTAGRSVKHCCLALDFRGHGESERPEHGYRVSRLAQDCGDFFDHLGLDKVVFLGHSAGCTVIWSFIDLFGQDRIRALILCDEMVAFVRRPEWSEEDCCRYWATVAMIGARHFLHWENPVKFNAAVRHFLETVDSDVH